MQNYKLAEKKTFAAWGDSGFVPHHSQLRLACPSAFFMQIYETIRNASGDIRNYS